MRSRIIRSRSHAWMSTRTRTSHLSSATPQMPSLRKSQLAILRRREPSATRAGRRGTCRPRPGTSPRTAVPARRAPSSALAGPRHLPDRPRPCRAPRRRAARCTPPPLRRAAPPAGRAQVGPALAARDRVEPHARPVPHEPQRGDVRSVVARPSRPCTCARSRGSASSSSGVIAILRPRRCSCMRARYTSRGIPASRNPRPPTDREHVDHLVDLHEAEDRRTNDGSRRRSRRTDDGIGSRGTSASASGIPTASTDYEHRLAVRGLPHASAS